MRAGRGGTPLAAFALLAGALAGIGAGGSSAGAAGTPPGDPPNFVVIMTDDQRFDELERMPAVNRLLRRRGTTFANTYATFPLCCPSRASFLTGQYAHNHLVLDNSAPDGGVGAFIAHGGQDRTLAVALDDAGYRTGYIGKYLNGYPRLGVKDPVGSIPPGWDRWLGALDNRMYDWRLNANGKVREFGKRARDYQTDVYARKSNSFIRQSSRAGDSFFLYVSTLAPHVENGVSPRRNPRPAKRHEDAFRGLPFFPRPPSFNETDVSDKPSFIPAERFDSTVRKRLAKRYRDRLTSLLAVDNLVRGVVNQLRKAGALANTYVVFTSDNGYLLGEHRLRKKRSLYEEAARIPFVMRGPGIPAATNVEAIAANIDLAPTILEAAGVTAPDPVDGIDLTALAQNPAAGADRTILLDTARSIGVRSATHMYAEHETDGDPGNGPDEFELYEMLSDPFQLENVYNESQAPGPGPPRNERKRLEQRLEELRDCSGSTCR